MTPEEQILAEIHKVVAALPAQDRTKVHDLVEGLDALLIAAGEPAATLAIALIGAERQCPKKRKR